MTPSQALQRVSEALYGDWCPSALASDLGVSERSVRRWGASSHPIQNTLWADLVLLCQDRAYQIDCTVEEIEKMRA